MSGCDDDPQHGELQLFPFSTNKSVWSEEEILAVIKKSERLQPSLFNFVGVLRDFGKCF